MFFSQYQVNKFHHCKQQLRREIKFYKLEQTDKETKQISIFVPNKLLYQVTTIIFKKFNPHLLMTDEQANHLLMILKFL